MYHHAMHSHDRKSGIGLAVGQALGGELYILFSIESTVLSASATSTREACAVSLSMHVIESL